MYNNMPYPGFPSYAQANVLPPQQVLQVNGKPSIDAMRMSPNSSLLAMDITAPIVWLCVSDGVGKVNAVPYDITEHRDIPPAPEQPDWAKALDERMCRIENMTAEFAERIKSYEPDAPKPNSKSNK